MNLYFMAMVLDDLVLFDLVFYELVLYDLVAPLVLIYELVGEKHVFGYMLEIKKNFDFNLTFNTCLFR